MDPPPVDSEGNCAIHDLRSDYSHITEDDDENASWFANGVKMKKYHDDDDVSSLMYAVTMPWCSGPGRVETKR